MKDSHCSLWRCDHALRTGRPSLAITEALTAVNSGEPGKILDRVGGLRPFSGCRDGREGLPVNGCKWLAGQGFHHTDPQDARVSVARRVNRQCLDNSRLQSLADLESSNEGIAGLGR